MAPGLVSIVGFPRSGSTLLGDVLGSCPDACHVGELALLAQRTLRNPARACSCGTDIRSCPVWGASLDEARSASGLELGDVAAAVDDIRSGAPAPPSLTRFHRHLLAGVRDRTGSRTLVDSSNWPSFGRHLADVDPDVAFVHLLRDPRAAVHSRTRGARRRLLRDASELRVAGSIIADVRRWDRWNRGAEHLRHEGSTWTQIRYESFVSDPSAALTELGETLRLETTRLVQAGRVDRSREHVVWGNRRGRPGPTTLRLDDAWRREGPRWQRRLSSVLSWPSRRHFGYDRGPVGRIADSVPEEETR